GRHTELAVEQRMVVEEEWFEPSLLVRPGEAAGVRQLQADEQVVCPSEALMMFSDEHFAQVGEVGEGVVAEEQLIGISPAIGADRDSLAAPDELGSARPEALPAAARQLARSAVARAVPALHRQDGETIADGRAVHFARLGQRRFRAMTQRLVE